MSADGIAPYARDVENIYPLSFAQNAWLFHSLQFGMQDLAFLQNKFTLMGQLDPSVFDRAWQTVVDRHQMLRTSFHWKGVTRPLQVVHRGASLSVRHEDLRELSADEQLDRIGTFLVADRELGFDLTRPPLMRMTLFRTGAAECELVWSLHHLLMDGWSAYMVCKEAFDLNDAFRNGSEPSLEPPQPFGNYIAWLEAQDSAPAEAFWRQELRGFTTATPLPFDRAPADLPCDPSVFEEQEVTASSSTANALDELTRSRRLTLSTLMQGCWALLLSRHSGEEDVVFGVTVSGRPPALSGVETMVGLFINTLPLRVRLSEDEPLVPWLERIQKKQTRAQRFQYSSSLQIHQWSDLPLGEQLFGSLLVCENYPRGALEDGPRSLKLSNLRGGAASAHPLMAVVVAGHELRMLLRYDRRRFSVVDLATLLNAWKAMLDLIADNPDSELGAIGSSMPAGA